MSICCLIVNIYTYTTFGYFVRFGWPDENKQTIVLIQFLNGFLQLKILNNLNHIITKPTQVILKVHIDILWVWFQSVQIIFGMIEEGGVDFIQNDWSGVIYFLSVLFVDIEHIVFVGF